MNTLARWGKFNLVGVMGMVAQLGSLAVLNRIVPGHYLAARPWLSNSHYFTILCGMCITPGASGGRRQRCWAVRAIPFVEWNGVARGKPRSDEGTGRGCTAAVLAANGSRFVLLACQFLPRGDVDVWS